MKTLTVNRVEFLRKEQSENESFPDHLLNLEDCEWNVTENDMIKLQIIKEYTIEKREKFSRGNLI